MDNSNLFNILRKGAEHLDSIRTRRCLARPFYELLADALIWPDETTKSTPSELIVALRIVYHYRTGIILGEQRRFADEWQLGLRLFPHWVGFHPSRRRMSPRFARIYRAGYTLLHRDLEKL